MVAKKMLAASLFAMLVACTTATTRPSPPTGSGVSATCGPAAASGTNPPLPGPAVGIGPLWLHGFADSSGRAVIRLGARHLTKVLIRVPRVAGETVDLRGQDCSSGQAIRFCYDLSTGACRGSSAGVTVQKVELGGLDHTGYILFPATGNYRLQVTLGAQQLGEAVVHVRSPR